MVGAVQPVEQREGGVRELEPQVNQGDDDPVGERQLMVRACALSAQPVAAASAARSRDSCCAAHGPASSAISLPSGGGGSPVKIRCDKAARPHLDDTS